MNFDKRSYFRTRTGEKAVTELIDQAHNILTAVVGVFEVNNKNPRFTNVAKVEENTKALKEARGSLDKLRGDITQRNGNIIQMRSKFRQPGLNTETTTQYLQAQEIRKYILEKYPQPELRERVLPGLMAQNELVIQAISSCPLPEIRRTFVSDEAFSAGVDSWIRANNDPAQVAYADRADEINEECLMNLRIAENAMSAAAGEVTKESAAGGVLTRAALDALPPADRGAHFRAGGTVTD